MISNTQQEIIEFIQHFRDAENTFLHGCCYWFAKILHDRFGLFIVYEPVEGHFLAHQITQEENEGTRGAISFKTHLYDIRGEVTQQYAKSKLYEISWLQNHEPNWYAHLMRDCRDFGAAEEELEAI